MRTATALVKLLAFTCLLPQPARATSVCATMPAPAVVVRTAEKPAKFDMKQSMAQLAALKQQGGHGAPHPLHASVGGLMEGMVKLDHKIGYNVKTDQKTGLSCIQFTHIIVNLWLEPKVYVASDLTGQSCWYREVFAHEAKHVAADRTLLKKYQYLFTEGLNLLFLDPADYASGFMPAGGSVTSGVLQTRQRLNGSASQSTPTARVRLCA